MRASRPHIITVTLGGLAVALSCSSPDVPDDSTFIEHRVRPSDANAAITMFNEEHFVWVPPRILAEGSRQLLLLLPGTNGRPAHGQLLGGLAAQQGYHVIGLMYPDDRAVVDVCAADPAPDCMALVREEIVLGTDRSPHVAVDTNNGIDARLRDLVRLLGARYANEGWSTFLDAGGLRWSFIAVAGLSQGGGHAAYIAKLRAVPRVIMFGAPADGYGGNRAPWMSVGATPATRYFGFAHQRDPFASIVPNWLALGLDVFGAARLVETSSTPFGSSHMLRTNVLPASGTYDDAHASVFVDALTPRGPGGTPVFVEAWRYLLGAVR
jgi:hypothetical protein